MLGLFSSICVLCDSTVDGKISICEGCYADLPRMLHSCKRCGVFLNEQAGIDICGACQSHSPNVDYTQSALQYLSPVDYLITELKFNQSLSTAAILSDLLSQHLQQYFQTNPSSNLPDLIIPVPLHKKRLSTRGFNQAVELAKPIASKYLIPLCKDAVIRTKNTAPQSELDAKKRQKNIRNSFEIGNMSRLKEISHVVILDDVVTTGATCNELAGLLKKSGVKKVGVWSVARA